jgi:hypothetical protein
MGLLKSIGKLDLELTVGAGQPGPKTRGLRNDKKDIQESGFHYPINIALTPAFLQRRLMDANVQPSDNREGALKKLDSVPFTDSERAEIARALQEFPPGARSRLIVRSDESAEGNGLMASVKLFPKDTIDALVTVIESVVARIMAGEYGNHQLDLYKKIAGIEGNTGILIMPIYGEAFQAFNFGKWKQVTSPAFGLNYLGPFNKKSLLSVFSEGDVLLSDQLAIENPDGTRRELENATLRDTLFAVGGLPPHPRYKRTLIDRISRFTRRAGPRYVEVVKDSWDKPEFVIVQSAPFSCPQIKKPSKKEWKTDIRANLAFGIATANTHECRHVNATFMIEGSKEEFEALKDYDTSHKGYLLAAEGMGAGMFLNMLYGNLNVSNAGAIVLVFDGQNKLMAFSHLGGFFRALGIPIIITAKEPSFMNELREKKEMNLECAVYSNQFDREGILALKRN